MLKEAGEFLRLSIINLLAYKHLVCGKYLAWARVTAYYSQFYVANSFLRLRGFALAHLDFIDDNSSITVTFEKQKNKPFYFFNTCSSGGHELVWETMGRLYPEIADKKLGNFFMRERIDWNYDLFYASQSTSSYAIEEAEKRCKNNFLDPNFGSFEDLGAQEYYHDLKIDYGIEELGTAEYQQRLVSYLTEVAKLSENKASYVDLFSQVLEDIELLESSADIKRELSKTFINARNELQKPNT